MDLRIPNPPPPLHNECYLEVLARPSFDPAVFVQLIWKDENLRWLVISTVFPGGGYDLMDSNFRRKLLLGEKSASLYSIRFGEGAVSEIEGSYF